MLRPEFREPSTTEDEATAEEMIYEALFLIKDIAHGNYRDNNYVPKENPTLKQRRAEHREKLFNVFDANRALRESRRRKYIDVLVNSSEVGIEVTKSHLPYYSKIYRTSRNIPKTYITDENCRQRYREAADRQEKNTPFLMKWQSNISPTPSVHRVELRKREPTYFYPRHNRL
jgi:hypothetical protein